MRFRISPRVAHPQEVSVRAPPPPGCVHTDCACFRTGPRVAHPREVSVRAPPPHGCVHTDCACFRTGPRVAHPREVSVRAPPPHGCVHTDCACFRTGPRVAHPREVSVRAPPPHGCVHTDCACRRACVRRRCACRRPACLMCPRVRHFAGLRCASALAPISSRPPLRRAAVRVSAFSFARRYVPFRRALVSPFFGRVFLREEGGWRGGARVFFHSETALEGLARRVFSPCIGS